MFLYKLIPQACVFTFGAFDPKTDKSVTLINKSLEFQK